MKRLRTLLLLVVAVVVVGGAGVGAYRYLRPTTTAPVATVAVGAPVSWV